MNGYKICLFLSLVSISLQTVAQVKIEYIREKIITIRDVVEDDWVIARDSNSAFNMLGQFDLTKDYDFFIRSCTVEHRPKESFFCFSPDREWLVIASVTKLEGTKLLLIDELKYYACVSKPLKEVYEEVWAYHGIKRIYRDKHTAGGWFEQGGQKIYISIVDKFENDHGGRRGKYFPICRYPVYLEKKIERSNKGDAILAESIYMLRKERSKIMIPNF